MAAVPETDVIRQLAKLVHDKGPTLREAAAKLGYSDCYLSKMLNQRARIPKLLLDQLGYQRVTIYEVRE
jgi:hypothetical protein